MTEKIDLFVTIVSRNDSISVLAKSGMHQCPAPVTPPYPSLARSTHRREETTSKLNSCASDIPGRFSTEFTCLGTRVRYHPLQTPLKESETHFQSRKKPFQGNFSYFCCGTCCKSPLPFVGQTRPMHRLLAYYTGQHSVAGMAPATVKTLSNPHIAIPIGSDSIFVSTVAGDSDVSNDAVVLPYWLINHFNAPPVRHYNTSQTHTALTDLFV